MTVPYRPRPTGRPRRRRLWPILLPLLGAAVVVAVAASMSVGSGQRPPAAPEPSPTAQAAPPAPPAQPTAAPSPTTLAAARVTPVPTPHGLIDAIRFTYEPGWGTLDVQRFLDSQPGTLKSMTLPAGRERISVASAIATQCLLYSINPKVMLTLLEMQSGLVRGTQPSPNELGWALGYRQTPAWGVAPQINWAARELYRAARDDPSRMASVGFGTYAVERLLLQTVDRDTRAWPADRAAPVFAQTYRELFGEDPRLPLSSVPAPAAAPFLRSPFENPATVSSAAFDHEYPLLSSNGGMVSFRGRPDWLDYDGHNGWDYAMFPGVPVLAAAAGRVLVAGWSDDGCPTPAGAVILDHDNGYRTFYWHLSSITVAEGSKVTAGDLLGKSGATGCVVGAHLHFGVQYLGRATDPSGWCKGAAGNIDPWAVHPGGAVSRWLWVDEADSCK